MYVCGLSIIHNEFRPAAPVGSCRSASESEWSLVAGGTLRSYTHISISCSVPAIWQSRRNQDDLAGLQVQAVAGVSIDALLLPSIPGQEPQSWAWFHSVFCLRPCFLSDSTCTTSDSIEDYHMEMRSCVVRDRVGVQISPLLLSASSSSWWIVICTPYVIQTTPNNKPC